MRKSLTNLKINVYDEDSDSYMPENIVDLVNNIFNIRLTEDYFYNIEERDIITQSQLEELTDLFLSADLNKRQEIINSFKL